MSIFCKHEWEVIVKTYQSSGLETIRENGGQTYDRYTTGMIGYTSILMKCKKCSRTKVEVMRGKETKAISQ